jgi:aldehyde dehydrogenase (NAD+)
MMTNASNKRYRDILLAEQKDFFLSGKTLEIEYRLEQLKTLEKSLTAAQDEIIKALKEDMRKPEFEAYGSDILPVFHEIRHATSNLAVWSKPQRIEDLSDPFDPQVEAYIYPEPYGTVLIMAPWNYPVQLLLNPLVGAIAAGNCTTLKPSEFAPATAGVMAKLIEENFERAYIDVVRGGAETGATLLQEPFDYIFFTGSARVARLVMKAAAENLVPLTLELGGKSPCIVDKEANLEKAAERIVWGKFFNAGQTCIAPDYLLVQTDIWETLLNIMISNLRAFFGDDPQKSKDYARIINESHFNRLVGLLNSGKTVAGGTYDKEDLYIAPTMLDNVNWDDPVMIDEIFGPILPVIEYEDLDDTLKIINRRPKPLALYIFSENRAVQDKVIASTSYGGGCINDVLQYETFPFIPFGGIGQSGMGSYHGKTSFDTFSHKKSILKRGSSFNSSYRNPPYNDIQISFVKEMIQGASE